MKVIQIPYKPILQGTILDFEATHFDAKQGELITAGFLSIDGFKIFQRLNLDEKEFTSKVIENMRVSNRPWYAYHKKVEEDFCGLEIDCDLQDSREATYIALRNAGLLDHYNSLCDPLFNDEVPFFWNVYLNTRNSLPLSKIVRHNYCCLVKEYYLKLRKVDGYEPENIRRLLSSAPIEKIYIRQGLEVQI
jgi:hypothetical protein